MTRIAVPGPGAAGGGIARDLVAAGADVRGFDPLVAPPDGVDVALMAPVPGRGPLIEPRDRETPS